MKPIINQYIDLIEGKMNQSQFLRNVRISLPQYVTNVTSFKDTVKILKNKGILTEGLDIDQLNGQEVLVGTTIEHDENPGKNKEEYLKIVVKNLNKDPYYYTNYQLTGERGVQPEILGSTKEGSDQMTFVDKKGDNLVDKLNQQKITIPNAKASSNKSSKESSVGIEVDIMAVTTKALRGVVKSKPISEKVKIVHESKLDKKSKDKLKEVILKFINESTEKKVKVGDKIKLTKDCDLGKQKAEFKVTDKNIDKLKSISGSYIITYKS